MASRILPILPLFGEEEGITAKEMAFKLQVSLYDVNSTLSYMQRHCKEFPVLGDQEDDMRAPLWWTLRMEDHKQMAKSVVADIQSLAIAATPTSRLVLFDISQMESVFKKCDSTGLFTRAADVRVVVWADKSYSGVGSDDDKPILSAKAVEFHQSASDHKQAADVRICDEVTNFMTKCDLERKQAVILVVTKDSFFASLKELASGKGHILTIEHRFDKIRSWFQSSK